MRCASIMRTGAGSGTPGDPKQSTGYGSPKVYRSNPVVVRDPPPPPPLDVAGYYGASTGDGVPPPLLSGSFSPAYNIVLLSFLSFDQGRFAAGEWTVKITMNTDGKSTEEFPGGGWAWSVPLDPLPSSFDGSLEFPHLTYLNGTAIMDRGGPANLKSAISEWRDRNSDVWGRTRRVLLSVGGQNSEGGIANALQDISVARVAACIKWILHEDQLGLDGVDIQVQNCGTAACSAIAAILKTIKQSPAENNEKIWVSCAPQAVDAELAAYEGIIAQSDYVGVRYYDNPISQLAPPGEGRLNWGPFCVGAPLPTSCPPQYWEQSGFGDFADTRALLYAAAQLTSQNSKSYGILLPAGAKASNGSAWDFSSSPDLQWLLDALKSAWSTTELDWSGNSKTGPLTIGSSPLYLGTWDITWDAANNYIFSQPIKGLLHYLYPHPPPRPTGPTYTVSGSTSNVFNGKYVKFTPTTSQPGPTLPAWAQDAYVQQDSTDPTATPTLYAKDGGPHWVLGEVDLTTGTLNAASATNPIVWSFCATQCSTPPHAGWQGVAGAVAVTVTLNA